MKIVVTSHGDFCHGLLESYGMIAGASEDILAISLDDKGVDDFRNRLNSLLNELISDHEVLILCDIKGGTPFNESFAFSLVNSEKVRIVSGMNLPMLIESGLLLLQSPTLDDLAQTALNAGSSSIELEEPLSIEEEDDDLGL